MCLSNDYSQMESPRNLICFYMDVDVTTDLNRDYAKLISVVNRSPDNKICHFRSNRERQTLIWSTKSVFDFINNQICGAFNKFRDFFVQAFKIVVDSWKFTMLLLYIFRFKWTATVGIGIHPTKAWLSQLVNFKNAIWMWRLFRRTICNKNLF